METNKDLSRRFKRMVLDLAKTKKELNSEKEKNLEILKLSLKPRLGDDLLRKADIEKEYRISQKTIDRMRARGLKTSQSSYKSTVWVVRKDLEDFMKKDRYGR